MKKLILALMMIPAVLFAAETYYNFPDATSLPDAGRILIRDGSTNKNITGLKLKQEIAAFANMSATINITTADQLLTTLDNPVTRALTKKSATDASQYARQMEVKDSTGKITYYVQSNGTVVVGTPAVLTVSSVSPANGATGFAGPIVTTTFNKDPLSLSSSYIYVNGKTTTNGYGSTQNIVQSTAYLAPSTSYTFKVVKDTLATLQVDGETTASCGTAMTDVSGVCQSTFTTGSINIYSVTPSAGSSEIPGTDGGAFGTTPQMMFGLTYTLSAGQFTCSSSYWNGSSWVADTTPGAFANTGNIIYTLPSMVYHKSYDSSHLTTYTCSVPKSIGLSACGAGTTDTGTLCQWTFTTAQ